MPNRFRLRQGQFRKITYMPTELSYEGDGEQVKTGNVFYVDSGAANAADQPNNGTVDAPFATTNYAITRCTANNGDIIHPMPGHAETLTAAAAIAQSIAGIRIFGLGEGASRPRYTFQTAAGASWSFTAASSKIKNIIGIGNLDGLTNPFHVQAADCELDIEWQDTSATVEALRAVLTTAAADRFKCRLKYRGFTGGNAVVNAIRLVGGDGADIYIEAFGVCTTAWVEFATTLCTNVRVEGILFTQGITNGTRNVVDTITGSTWSADLFDASAGQHQSGGSAQALGFDDIATVAANQTVPAADSTANVLSRDVVGAKDDAAQTTVGTTRSIIAYVKGLLNQIGALVNTGGTATIGAMLGDHANVTLAARTNVPTADVATNALTTQVVGNKTDAAIADTIEGAAATTQSLHALTKAVLQRVGADSANNTAATTLVAANRDGSLLERLEYQHTQDEITVTRTTAALPQAAAAAIFTVTGLIEMRRIVGYVTTVIGAVANATRLVGNSTGAGASTDLCATLDINGHAVDRRYEITGTFANAMVSTLDLPLAVVQVTNVVIPPGTIDLNCAGSDGGTGRVRWSITYKPLEVGATVVAA